MARRSRPTVADAAPPGCFTRNIGHGAAPGPGRRSQRIRKPSLRVFHAKHRRRAVRRMLFPRPSAPTVAPCPVSRETFPTSRKIPETSILGLLTDRRAVAVRSWPEDPRVGRRTWADLGPSTCAPAGCAPGVLRAVGVRSPGDRCFTRNIATQKPARVTRSLICCRPVASRGGRRPRHPAPNIPTRGPRGPGPAPGPSGNAVTRRFPPREAPRERHVSRETPSTACGMPPCRGESGISVRPAGSQRDRPESGNAKAGAGSNCRPPWKRRLSDPGSTAGGGGGAGRPPPPPGPPKRGD